MGAIFISYRRSDSEGQSGRLFRDLRDHFGRDAVLIDVVGMAKGRDFRRTIEARLDASSVFLAVIGKTWLTTTDEHGAKRLEDPRDLVRLETVTALRKDLPVIPVLVGGARMPLERELPDDLKDLAYRDGVEMTHARWDYDIKALIDSLGPIVQPHSLPTSQPRQKARLWLYAVMGVLVASSAMLYVFLSRNPERPLQVSGRSPDTGHVRDVGDSTAKQDGAAEKAAAEKAAADKAASDRAASDKAASDKALADKAATDRAATEKAVLDKAVADKASADKAAAERAVAEKAAAELRALATSTVLTGQGRSKLDDLVQKLRQTKLSALEVIIVVGHTDNTQSAGVSKNTSVARAEVVKRHLVSAGIEANRIYAEGKGKEQPVADNRTAEGRAKNNRAEIEIVGTRVSDSNVSEKVVFGADVLF